MTHRRLARGERIVIATHNAGKLREVSALLAPHGIVTVSAAELGLPDFEIAFSNFVAPTAGDARDVMVEGESGILACAPPGFRPKYEPSKRRLTYPNGAKQFTYSADEPDRLRGPQHWYAWIDEWAAMKRKAGL